MKLPIKRLHPAAILPAYATAGACALDLHACIDEPVHLHPGDCILIPTGFAMALPPETGGFILPRSGLGTKHGVILGNGLGLADFDFRGQVMVAAWNRNRGGMPFTIRPGERIAQMAILPVLRVEPMDVDALDSTARGQGGFGSTGTAALSV